MTWNSSPLRLNRRAEISSPSALAQWTEHRKACAETAPRFFCAAVAACFIRTSVGIEPGRFRTLAKMSGSGKLLAPRSHLWPILAGSRELGSNPLYKKRAFLRSDRFGVSSPGDSSRIVGQHVKKMLGHLCSGRVLGIVPAVLPSSFLVIKSFSVVAELELSISDASCSIT